MRILLVSFSILAGENVMSFYWQKVHQFYVSTDFLRLFIDARETFDIINIKSITKMLNMIANTYEDQSYTKTNNKSFDLSYLIVDGK